jgi:hypothetical protein
MARALLLVVLICLAAACERFDDAPRDVAGRFWSALEVEDFDAARTLSTSPSVRAVRELAEAQPLEEIELGEILRNEATAIVDTSAILAPSGLELAFSTHLTRVDGAWRVDVRKTHRELTRAALATSFEGMQQSLRESSEAVLEEFERRALEASEALREALEELERSLRGEERT